MQNFLSSESVLPADHENAVLIGRVWEPEVEGPTPVWYRQGHLYDISPLAPTVSELIEISNLPARLNGLQNPRLVTGINEVLSNSQHDKNNPSQPYLLAPCDLQAIKASGVTFVASMLERVIEERAGGDKALAENLRQEISEIIGDDLSLINPGSDSALQLKAMLIEKNVWSQYLEVGIGPYAEIFTKSQPMSAVGIGAQVGLHPVSTWNNPEPEVVLTINSRAEIVGATLGNDVNLRDIEGRSALLLGKAKDNNASCAVGPFIRLFDGNFTLEKISQADIQLNIYGDDEFELDAVSSMSKISRSPKDLVSQTIGSFHQYPDGVMLFLGTMFAPVVDRGEKGKGFTHHVGDRVTISTPLLGSLVNWVNFSDKVNPWTFGAGALMKNLVKRKLI